MAAWFVLLRFVVVGNDVLFSHRQTVVRAIDRDGNVSVPRWCVADAERTNPAVATDVEGGTRGGWGVLGFGRFRNQVALTGSEGCHTLGLDLQDIAQPNGTVAANVGESWYFQAWFHDSAQSSPTSSLPNGLAIEFGV